MHSIKTKLLFIFLFVMGIALLFQIFHITPYVEEEEIKRVNKDQLAFAKHVASDLEANMRLAMRELNALAALPETRSLEKPRLDRVLTIAEAANKFFDYYFVMDRNGVWLSFPNHPELVGSSIPEKNMGWVDETFETNSTVFVNLIQTKIATLTYGFAAPIRDAEGKPVALLRGVLSATGENTIFRDVRHLRLGENDIAYVVSTKGWLLAHSETPLNYDDFEAYQYAIYEPVKKALAGESGTMEYAYEGEDWLITYQPVPLANCAIIIQRPINVVLRAVKLESRFITLLLMGCFAIAFLVISLMIHYSLKPMEKLVKDIKSGSMDAKFSYPKDEIGQIARQFNDLYANLFHANQRLRITEISLKNERERFRNLVETAPYGIALIDALDNISYVNSRFTDMFGYDVDDIPTMPVCFEKVYPDEKYRRNALEAWEKDTRSDSDFREPNRHFTVTCADGSQKDVDFRLVPLSEQRWLVICEDVTERKKLEAAFLQAQKMESIGTLAGGVAHDFNNLLMAIQGTVSILTRTNDNDQETLEHLQSLEQCVTAGANLTGQLLGLARGGKYQVKPLDVNAIFKATADMFGRTHKEIRIIQRLDDSLKPVEADAGQLEQVFLNLFVNAWQAMPDGGDLILETKNVTLSPSFANSHSLDPGDHARITVSDNGPGIVEGIQDKIFDPFFTTKEVGQGSGLGLSSSYGIIKNHNGALSVESAPGKGATFTILLPVSTKSINETIDETGEIEQGAETILVIDDDAMITAVVGRMLTELGYDVITANSGQEGVDLYEKRKNNVNLVILDMIMPDMSGAQAFAKLREINPTLKVILASGYSLDDKAREIMNAGCDGFMQKPFDMKKLSNAVRSVLAHV